jgi:hypothetical protein
MATNRKATMAKRQRELAQKDRVQQRADRRAERRSRAQERAASGAVGSGPPIGKPIVLDENGIPIPDSTGE